MQTFNQTLAAWERLEENERSRRDEEQDREEDEDEYFSQQQ